MIPSYEDLLSQIASLTGLDYVIVEGKKDRIALESFGINNILCIDKPLFAVCESIPKGAKVAILTDLDAEGRKLYAKIKRDLATRGVFTEDSFRQYLFRYTDLRQIEGLRTFVANSLSSSEMHRRRV